MRRKIIISIVAALLFYVFLYPKFVITIIAGVQSYDLKEIRYNGEIEPKDRKAEIVIVALKELTKESKFGSDYYWAIDASELKGLTVDEERSILYNMRLIHKRSIYFSYGSIKGIGLIVPYYGIRSGVCLQICSIKRITNEEAILTVASHESGFSGGGEDLIMKFVDGKWKVDSITSKFYAGCGGRNGMTRTGSIIL